MLKLYILELGCPKPSKWIPSLVVHPIPPAMEFTTSFHATNNSSFRVTISSNIKIVTIK